jgi:hypothetical protein
LRRRNEMKVNQGYYFSMTRLMPVVKLTSRGLLVAYPTGWYAKHYVEFCWKETNDAA